MTNRMSPFRLLSIVAVSAAHRSTPLCAERADPAAIQLPGRPPRLTVRRSIGMVTHASAFRAHLTPPMHDECAERRLRNIPGAMSVRSRCGICAYRGRGWGDRDRHTVAAHTWPAPHLSGPTSSRDGWGLQARFRGSIYTAAHGKPLRSEQGARAGAIGSDEPDPGARRAPADPRRDISISECGLGSCYRLLSSLTR